jgi:transcriptional regulator with XRE-family HTH domain
MLKERLKNLRLSKGMTLQKVGDAFGISRASVSSWESGTNQPDPRKLEKLAELFGSSVEYLITGSTHSTAELMHAENPNLVPFVAWDSIPINLEKTPNLQTITCLYSKPGKNAFATRFISSSSLDWQPGPIPAGSIIVVDPNKALFHGSFVIAKINGMGLEIGQTQNPESKEKFVIKLCNNQTTLKVDKSVSVIGVILEWRIGSKV